jgi:predicted dienelactone hydrolase
MVSPAYPMKKGNHEVRAVHRIVLDRVRDSQHLTIKVYFPESEGSYPVIIWSHGLGFNKNLYRPLIEFWVTHGYITVCANHLDAISGECVDDYEVLRTDDIKFIVDALPVIEKKTLRPYGVRVDTGKLGIGGHSLGAHTAQLIGGVKKKNGQTYRDERPKAFLLISPKGTGGSLGKGAWSEFDRPALVITGTEDASSKTGMPFTWRMEGFHGMPPGDKFLVQIKGAYHGFGGITGLFGWKNSGPANNEHVEAVQSASLFYWNGYLKGCSGEIRVLRSRFIDKRTHEAVSVSWK